MVGSSRGEFRLVGWESLFKDGSFTKNVARVDGPRVRRKARQEEMAKEKAEAKLGAELRETKRELHAGKKQQEMEKNAEERLKGHEMEARKAEKDLTVSHKRQLHKMLEDNIQGMLEDNSQGMQTLREDEEEK